MNWNIVATICNVKGQLQIKSLQSRIVYSITYAQLQGFGLRCARHGAIVPKVQRDVLNCILRSSKIDENSIVRTIGQPNHGQYFSARPPNHREHI